MHDLFSASPSVGSTIIQMMWSLWLTIHQLAFGLKMMVTLLFLQYVKENTGIVNLENSVNISIYLYKIYDCHKIVYFWKNVIIGASFNNSSKKKKCTLKRLTFANYQILKFLPLTYLENEQQIMTRSRLNSFCMVYLEILYDLQPLCIIILCFSLFTKNLDTFTWLASKINLHPAFA